MNQDRKTIGLLIKEKRTAERLSAEDLAIKLGLKKENIYKWERGSKPSDPEVYAKVTNWLNNLENVPHETEVKEPEIDFYSNPSLKLLAEALKSISTSHELLMETHNIVVKENRELRTGLNSGKAVPASKRAHGSNKGNGAYVQKYFGDSTKLPPEEGDTSKRKGR